MGVKRDIRLTTLFLGRSRDQPLALILDDLQDSHQSLVGGLLGRARSLSTSSRPVDILTRPAPYLEELTLRHCLQGTSHYLDGPLAVYRKLSNHPLGKLRELTLRGCCLSLKPGNYMGLRRLEITACLQPDSIHTDLLVIFRESPLLEDLSLVSTTPTSLRQRSHSCCLTSENQDRLSVVARALDALRKARECSISY